MIHHAGEANPCAHLHFLCTQLIGYAVCSHLSVCAPAPGMGAGDRKDWQCRERWRSHLGPAMKKGNWSAAEDETILHAVNQLGLVCARLAVD